MGEALHDLPPRKPFAERNYERLVALGVLGAEALIRRTPDGNSRFFDPGAFPWAATLEAGWRDMRAELDALLQDRERLPRFQDVSEEQRSITSDDGWRVFVLRVFGHAVERNARRCPRTSALLDSVPGLRNAMFSILAPGKHIPPHRGVYAGLLRYHLALKVPPDAQACRIFVGGEERAWEEGRTLVFDDSFEHSVRNDTPQERVVLFADFVRPLPVPLRPVNAVVLAMLSRLELFQRPLERLERGEL